jgi:hypothetical protein
LTCRRCSECADRDHHWLDNGDFGSDPEDAEDPTGNLYVCKHCDAVGDDCAACEGSGELMDEEACNITECPACAGVGIVESKPRSYEDIFPREEGAS